MRPARPRTTSRARRRGVTLLEMLVTVALLLLMMLIIVSIFASATGAVTVSRAYTLLEQDLRRLDVTLRQDLVGVTCKMTPPNNPQEGLGYFEYAENALSDSQDEDSDDTLRFTAKAPEGRPFTGRLWVPKTVPMSDGRYSTFATLQPIPVISQYAEIIIFQRGDKLYRRVRLILPKQPLGFGNSTQFGSLNFGNTSNSSPPGSDPPAQPGDGRSVVDRFGFRTNLFEPFALFHPIPLGASGIPTVVSGTPFVSWQALNDISARPASANFSNGIDLNYAPIPNTMGDLTDRHNRYASPRFANDFARLTPGQAPGAFPKSWQPIPDGVPDDMNADGVFDYYPTLYWNSKAAVDAFGSNLVNDTFTTNGQGYYDIASNSTVGFGSNGVVRLQTPDVMGFPWVYPNAFTGGIQSSAGVLHSPDPTGATFNHNPLPTGDSLAVPDPTKGAQTWWGWPTYRETAAPTWQDPIKRINDPQGAPYFSDPIASTLGEMPNQQTVGLSAVRKANNSPFWLPPQPGPFSDGVPNTANNQNDVFDLTTAPVFEDDLLATNVRSFNVKAFDGNPRCIVSGGAGGGFVFQAMVPGYYDLGYASGINPATGMYDPTYASGVNIAPTVTATPPGMLDTLGHEGRMPPLVADNRVDAQYPTYDIVTNVNPTTTTTVAAGLGDNNAGLLRLRRTWDSWSTTYTLAPGLPLDPTAPYPLAGPLGGMVPGDTSVPPVRARGRAVVPSYPAPYPVPLRGIEIQIRMNDPQGRYVKTLTIRQDFSDKL